jgi:hypothetical protein
MTEGRTIVVSDPQGEPAVFERALACSGFQRGVDRLIVAGDIVGAEPGGAACVAAVEASGAEVLVGNHEMAFFAGDTIDEGPHVDPPLFALVRERVLAGAWKVAAEVEGVIVTHAGVSRSLLPMWERADRDPAMFAGMLNERWRTELPIAERGEFGMGASLILGPEGPLWWRPLLADSVLPGARQVAGHTPIELLGRGRAARELERRGLHLVDPFTRGWVQAGRPDPPPCRYAVVASSDVTVHGDGGRRGRGRRDA